jgi:hypothetical protein
MLEMFGNLFPRNIFRSLTNIVIEISVILHSEKEFGLCGQPSVVRVVELTKLPRARLKRKGVRIYRILVKLAVH